MKYKTMPEGTFLPTLLGYHMQAMSMFESNMFSLMDRNNEDYNGGNWNCVEFENGAMAMLFGDMETMVEVPEQQNYFSGAMSELALSMALNMLLCSQFSFTLERNFPETSELVAKNYHLLRDAFCPADDKGNNIGIFSSEDVGAVFRFLD